MSSRESLNHRLGVATVQQNDHPNKLHYTFTV